MKPTSGSLQSSIKLSTSMRSGLSAKFYMLLLVLSFITSRHFAQTVTWSEYYQQGAPPSPEQHQRWTEFLASLKDKKFASVTLSGTFDETGKTLSDPVAVNTLAQLLAEGTVGTVVSNGQTWTVTNCDIGNGVFGVGLKVDGTGTSCLCEDSYALRPLSLNDDWGGVNSPRSTEGLSCSVVSQTMKLVFYSGVKVVAEGATEICEGGTVVLKAQADICSAPLTYKWNTGETTQSIVVSKPGTYSVTVSDGNGCSAISAPFSVTNTTVRVSAGNDAVYCDEPVQLNAVGTSVGGKNPTAVHKICLFDAPGGSGNCEYNAANICLEGQTQILETTSYSTTTSIENPAEVRYIVYYTAWYPSTFNFKLNGQTVKSYTDFAPDGECETAVPMTFVLSQAELKQWWNEATSNTLEIEAVGAVRFDIAGLAVEIVTSHDSYSWTPSEGLNFTTIPNPTANPSKTTDYIVTYTDANGCKASDQVRVAVQCEELPVPPVAQCKPVTVNLTDACVANVTAVEFDNGSVSPSGLPLTYSISPAGPFAVGTTNVTFTVKDSNNNSHSCNTTITVKDVSVPTIVQPANVTVANTPGSCSATVMLPMPVASDNCSITIANDQQDNVFEVGTTPVTWTVTDASGNKQTATQLVTVTNAAPILSTIVGPTGAVAVGTNAVLAISYIDDNFSHATLDWGDGSAAVVMNNPAAIFEAGHAYASAGTYGVSIMLTDKCGSVTTTVYEPITVFDPRSGSVSGGGWFESPRGAYVRNPLATGRANFSFEARYNGYSNVPEGSASFKFKSGNINFKSSEFDLLLIDGETARLTGSGSVNGKPGHSILISMVDDDTKLPRDKKTKRRLLADRIRVKITDPAGLVIYDTQLGAADGAVAATNIGAGSIEIDNSANTFTDTIEEILSGFSDESTSVYPNPFVDLVNISFATEASEDITINMMDLAGRVIATGVFPVNANGTYTLDVPETANEGIYLLIIRQGSRIEIVTVAKN